MTNEGHKTQNPKPKTQNLLNDNIEEYLKQHENKEMLRFITCGSVDDGKSTLIGRLLYDSKMIFEDQLAAVKNETKKYGTVEGEEIDFALLIDGLQSEREQGITIDVAYRFFSTDKRKYIIADTPGHEQYTRNMVTGASTADLAVILIDARKGVLTQTRRHSFLVSLLGIRNIVVAINKMDLVDYDQERFEEIVNDYKLMYERLRVSLPYKNFQQRIDFIPLSALRGDNVVERSERMPWYEGEALLPYLDTIRIDRGEFTSFRYPVQYVNRPNLDFRGYAGTIASGTVKCGDKVIVYPSRKNATIEKIILPLNPEKANEKQRTSNDESTDEAVAPMAITLTLKEEIDISRGDLIVKEGEKEPQFSDSFEAMMVWMDEDSLKPREYVLKLYSKEANAEVESILFKRDVNDWEKIEAKTLKLNDIARVHIELSEPVAFDLYEESRRTGAFILIDKITNNTVAAGMIAGVSTKQKKERIYTEAEKALNAYIREFYPEWECKPI